MPTNTQSTPLTIPDLLDHVERMQTRLNQLERELQSQAALAQLGVKAAMLCHELNNVMTPLSARAQLSESNLDSQPLHQALARQVRLAATRIDAVARLFILGAIHGGETAAAACSVLDAVVEATREVLPGGKSADFVSPHVPNFARVRVEQPLLEQVLINLMQNAVSAASDPPRISIRAVRSSLACAECSTWNMDSKDRFSLTTNGRIAAWSITVTDDGVGIPSAKQPLVFKPFAARDITGSKTSHGLGLSICHTIIQNAGGTIRIVRSDPSGTEIEIKLPSFDDLAR